MSYRPYRLGGAAVLAAGLLAVAAPAIITSVGFPKLDAAIVLPGLGDDPHAAPRGAAIVLAGETGDIHIGNVAAQDDPSSAIDSGTVVPDTKTGEIIVGTGN